MTVKYILRRSIFPYSRPILFRTKKEKTARDSPAVLFLSSIDIVWGENKEHNIIGEKIQGQSQSGEDFMLCKEKGTKGKVEWWVTYKIM